MVARALDLYLELLFRHIRKEITCLKEKYKNIPKQRFRRPSKRHPIRADAVGVSLHGLVHLEAQPRVFGRLEVGLQHLANVPL